jgi:hypothetical protein
MARKSLIHLSLVTAVTLVASTSASAFVAPHQQLTSTAVSKLLNKGEKIIRPNTVALESQMLKSRFGASTQVEVDALSGAVRLITGDLSARASKGFTQGDLVDVATNWIASHEDILQVKLEDVAILNDATLMSDDTQFLSFNVLRDSTPVVDASINFRFKFGKLVQVQARTFGEALDDARSEFVSSTDAVERFASAATIQERGQVFRVAPTATGYKLVRVNSALVGIEGEKLSVQTDAATGELFESRDTRHYATGRAHGNVYARTYYQSPLVDAPMPELSVTTGATSVSADVDGAFSFTGSAAPSINGLKGLRINTRASTGTLVSRTAGTTAESGWDLNVNVTAEKDVAQTHTYRHLNLINEKARKYIDVPWLKSVVTANVNLGQTCNAYWDGTSVNFFSAGGGCGNTGLISDVMYHEWGHGLDSNTGGIDDGAFSEGYGDILSMLMTNDSRLGPGFKTTGGIVRDLEPNKVYPADAGEVHAEGLIIGGTIWDLLKALTAKYDAVKANDLVSNIAFKGIVTAKTYKDMYAASLVINDTDSDPATRAPDFCEINAAFTLHGLATHAADCP